MSSETITDETVNIEKEAVDLDKIMAQAERLSPIGKIKLIERLLSDIKTNLPKTVPTPRNSSYGILAHLGSGPSSEEIDETRREMYTKLDTEEYL
jgi:hypothetical protein